MPLVGMSIDLIELLTKNPCALKNKKASKPIDLEAFNYLVAGAGFEPTTFGL